MDFVRAFAYPLPERIICAIIGVPVDDHEKFESWTIATSKAKTLAAITILDAQLAKTAYVAGDAFSMGDIPVGVFSYRFHALVTERPPLVHFERWFAAISARQAFRDHILSMPLD